VPISPVLIIVPVLAVGVAGTLVAVRAREGDDAFALRQESLAPVSGQALERLVASADNPIPESGGRPGESAECRPGGGGERRNPWTCTVRYPSGDVVEYRVLVRPDRSIRGANADGTLIVTGCCAAE
jgi:hypothetical protein